jgi:hypothetical protein
MPIDKSRWKKFLPWLGWTCPTCQSGQLRLDASTYKELDTAASREARELEDFYEPEWLSWRFSGVMKCNNARCKEAAAVLGVKTVEESGRDEEGEEQYSDIYEVKFIDPAPTPFLIHDNIPEELSSFIRSASALFWSDCGAAANRIRQLTEALLTMQGVPEYRDFENKRGRFSLHDRIEEYAKQKTEAAELLHAVKWIGNIGSHAGDEIDGPQVLEGFEMIESVLDELFVNQRQKVLARARAINALARPAKNGANSN